MKYQSLILLLTVLVFLPESADAQRLFRRNRPAVKPAAQQTMNPEAIELKVMLDLYQVEALDLFKKSADAEWAAMTTGKEGDFKKSADAKLAFDRYHSDSVKYKKIRELREKATGLTAVDARAADKMFLAFEQYQLPPELLKKQRDLSSKIEMTFQNFRGTLDGKKYTNNELLEILEAETDSVKRQNTWEALKQTGAAVDEQVIELAKVRNEAANKLGFKNYWEMSVHFQDYKPEQLLAIFDELEKTTAPLFKTMKTELDAELAAKFNIPADQLMPWHYDNPFFQQAPPSKDVNPNDFYQDKTKKQIIDIAVNYYRHIGLPYEEVLKRSDMFDRDGKNQHAFSIDMDTLGDVRNLCNVKPTDEWMDTVLHEGGHGVYSLGCNRSLPFNLRDAAHIFTTEGVAMLFGAKARNSQWLVKFAGADAKKVNEVAAALKKQRIREQLIFCRWTIVMLHFEKALYENPDADLPQLWKETVEKYQLLKQPAGRKEADWASKPHFVIAPVYYHNYMLGELFAAQLRQTLGKDFVQDNPRIGKYLEQKVFAPGAFYPWAEFVVQATGEPLSPKAFAKELQ
jgi:peptidyl-dipeptidase A